MFIFAWCLFWVFFGAVAEAFFAFRYVQFFPLLSVWIFLILQFSWHRIILYIIFSGFLADILLGSNSYDYLIFGLTILPFMLFLEKRTSLQTNKAYFLSFNFILAFLFAVMRILVAFVPTFTFSFSIIAFSVIYIFLSAFAATFVGFFLMEIMAYFSRKVDFPEVL